MYNPTMLEPRVDVQEGHYKIVREVATTGTDLRTSAMPSHCVLQPPLTMPVHPPAPQLVSAAAH